MRESAWDVAEDIHEGKKILLVDDILDSGRTFKELFEDWGVQKEQVDVAVLIYNTDQGIVPEYYGRRINKAVDPSWVTFWWESDDEELCLNQLSNTNTQVLKSTTMRFQLHTANGVPTHIAT